MSDILTSIVSSLGIVLLLGVIVMVLAQATEATFGIRLRCLRKGLAAVLFETRKPLAPEATSDEKLRLYCRNDAKRALNFCQPGISGPRERIGRIFGNTIAPLDRQFLCRAIQELFPDLRIIAPAVVNRFARLSANLKGRLQQTTHILTLLWALAASVIYYRFPAGYWYTESSEYSGSANNLAQSIFPAGTGDDSGIQIATIGLTSILVAVAANLLNAMRGRRTELIRGQELDETQEIEPQETFKIGRDNCSVRAINFAGGGFDSIMQLGVIHALMTIQGRAPDAVVGLSTGAIPAAALAEVLQAGEAEESKYVDTMWKDLSAKDQLALQSARMNARVQRFRDFENAAYKARERLYDALTPDAYQIDSNDPLMPLKTPFYQTEERDHKIDSLSTQAGLIRLYNEFLELNIPFGTLVRILRRALGYLAAAEFSAFATRWSLRVLEFHRIWLLIGSNVRGVARLIPVFLRPLVISSVQVRPLSAGSIIFRFPINEYLLPAAKHSFFFVVLLVFWLGGSLLPLVPGVIVFYPGLLQDPWAWVWAFAGVYVISATLALFATYKFDTIHFRAAIRDNLRSVSQFVWLILKSLTILVVVFAAIRLLQHAVQFAISLFNSGSFAMESAAEFAIGVARWTVFWLAIGAIIFALVVATIAIFIGLARVEAFKKKAREPLSFGRWYLRKFLKSYNLDRSLFHTYNLRSFLIELFDKSFYGETVFSEVVSDSLKNETERSHKHPVPKKTVADYRSDHHSSPIHVGIAAANVLTGNLETISDKESVIRSIEAAMAIVPIFPAQEIGGSIYVDGTNVANVPTRALTTLLRDRVNPKSGTVQIYSVSPMPISQTAKPDDEQRSGPYVQLWDIVKRALNLQRRRDAQLEQKLTEYYTAVIPGRNKKGEFQNQIRIPHDKGPKSFNRAWVTPIEPSEPLNLNKLILLATKGEQRERVAETIADGCRASLEVMIQPTIKSACNENRPVRCKKAVSKHLASQKSSASLKVKTSKLKLPGSDGKFGPGLREICEHCALNRNSEKEQGKQRGCLELRALNVERPPWPHERALADDACNDDKAVKKKTKLYRKRLKKRYACIDNWPAGRDELQSAAKKCTRPTISLLFSGGVFRGVYQMGVLNALNELRVQPDLIAGASIGSITAAMVARVFSMEQDQAAEDKDISRPLRHRQIARLSAVYLAVDRVILTDLFADFIRNLTIRASRIGFSMRQADHFFRKYDYPRSGKFEKLARSVLAGLERLFYVNPYQLNKLVRAARDEKDAESVSYLRDYVQQWLQHMNVGVETLGAEPLRQLIEHFVIPDEHKKDPESTPFTVFSKNSMQLLATATNLTDGKLEIIGDVPKLSAEGTTETMLMEALLVSSAFPGVFRPRWSWDLRPQTIEKAQYIDGGVMDNLPIEPVFDFLSGAEAAGYLTRRPTNSDGSSAPHLMFAASLEAETPDLVYRDQWQSFKNYWPALRKRTKRLRYNTKADIYRKAERNLRAIYNSSPKEEGGNGARLHVLAEPIDVEVVTVIPKWLCGTFGFHPMLNFRRKRQARSIAHGCASTLLRFASVEDDYLKGWDISKNRLPTHTTFSDALRAWDKEKKSVPADRCWLRTGIQCPFAKSRLHELNSKLREGGEEDLIDSNTIDELSRIHEYCQQLKTHQPEES